MNQSEERTVEVVEIRPLKIPLEPSLVTAHGVWSVREGWLFRVEAGEGMEIRGIGEAGCVPGFGLQNPDDLLDQTPGRAFGLWTAVQPPISLPELVGSAVLGRDGDVAPGGRRKLKIGVGVVDEEIAMVRSAMESLPSGAKLRLDANGGLSEEAFIIWTEVLVDDRIEYLEQPFPVDSTAYEEGWIRAMEPKLALDESVLTYDDWLDWLDRGWGGWGIIKPSLAGIPDERVLSDSRIVISSAFESPVGWAAVAELALRYNPNLPGLDTLGRLKGYREFRASGGKIPTRWIAAAVERAWEGSGPLAERCEP